MKFVVGTCGSGEFTGDIEERYLVIEIQWVLKGTLELIQIL